MMILPLRLRRAIATLGLSTCFACASTVLAKDHVAPKGPVEPPDKWDISLLAGLSLTDGNSDTLGVHAGLDAQRLTDIDEIYLGTDFLYARDSGTTTNESVYVFGQYNRLLNEKAYLGLLTDFLYDDIAEVDYQIRVMPTLGYYLLKNDRTRLAIEVGGGYVWDDVGGVESDYWGLRFAQRLTHQLTDTLSFFESVSFVPEAEDWDNFVVDVEAGIESRMSDRLSLRIFARNRYDNTPAAGMDENDFGIFSGISLTLGPVDPVPPAGGAKNPKAPITGGSDWDLEFAAGFSLTDGNSDTLSVSADLLATCFTDAHEAYLGMGGAYGETGDVRNQERFYAFGQYNKMLNETIYVGARTDFLYDDINDLDYRVTPSLLLGANLINNETTKFALEAGPSFTWEEQAGIEDEYFGVYFGNRFSHQLNERVKIWQSAGLILDTDNTDNIVIDARAGLDVKIGDRLSLRTEVQNIYDAEPGPGVEENDFTLKSGLVVTF